MKRIVFFRFACLVALSMASAAAWATAPAAAQSSQTADAQAVPALEDWRQAAARVLPNKIGCFQADYPSQVWQKVDCGPPPVDPYRTIRPSQAEAITPNNQPLAGDWTMAPTNKITSATGRLQTLYNVTTVNGVNNTNGALVANAYSLQVNSDQLLPGKSGASSCTDSANAGCAGWVQFVFNSDGGLYIQEWFIRYLTSATQTCPKSIPFQSGVHCGVNVASKTLPSTAPRQFISMQGATLQGQALSGGLVSVTYTAGGHSYAINGTDRVGAFGNWTSAEFNVFGKGTNKSGTFNTVNFNAGAQITIGLTSDNDSSGTEPGCTQGSTTAETTDLFLGPCNLTTGPGIWFNEGQPAPLVTSIAPAAGSYAGGTSVVLNGGPFDQQVQVKFGSTVVPIGSCGGATCTVTSPAFGNGPNPVNVTAAYIFQNGSPGPFSGESPADFFTYVSTPTCNFSGFYCPYYENQPPSYNLTCGNTSDFYSWSGVPTSPVAPPADSMTLLAGNQLAYTGTASGEAVYVAACVPGTRNQCTSDSIETENWCYTHKPPPPPPTCSQCPGQKCCPNPYGGKGNVCVALTATCPPIQ